MFYVIGKEGCPYCDKALDYIELELEEDWEYTNIYEDNDVILLLMKHAGLNTVPQIFKDKEYVGGYSELVSKFKREDFNKEDT